MGRKLVEGLGGTETEAGERGKKREREYLKMGR